MKKVQTVLFLLSGMVILALISSACQTAKAATGLQDGQYQRADFILVLQQGHYSVGVPGDTPLEDGTFQIKGNQISFHVDKFSPETASGCGTFPDYSYQWSFDPTTNQLTLKPANDPCSDRVNDFTNFPFNLNIAQK